VRASPNLAQALVMETTGEFTVTRWRAASSRCGLAGSPTTFAFRVRMCGGPHSLDDDGFLVDWQDIHTYFRTRFSRVGRFPSCEQIALRACSDLSKRYGGRCHRIRVRVAPPGAPAGMTAHWHRPTPSTPSRKVTGIV
jgi:hypothetical protein